LKIDKKPFGIILRVSGEAIIRANPIYFAASCTMKTVQKALKPKNKLGICLRLGVDFLQALLILAKPMKNEI